MPYTPTVWTDEIPATSPIKYKISQNSDGDVATDATIEIVTEVTAGTPLVAANMNKIEEALQDAVASLDAIGSSISALLSAVYPVGCIYSTTVSTNPATVFGFGTWVAFGAGRVMVGAGTSDATYTAASTGGESNHTLIASEMPTHTHIQNAHNHTTPGSNFQHVSTAQEDVWVAGFEDATTSDTIAVNQNAGGGGAHNNMPPYVVVYLWKRTA